MKTEKMQQLRTMMDEMKSLMDEICQNEPMEEETEEMGETMKESKPKMGLMDKMSKVGMKRY